MAVVSRVRRLFVRERLFHSAVLALGGKQAHRMLHVLCMKIGDSLLLFNGLDGEWRAELVEAGRRGGVFRVIERIRGQAEGSNIVYMFAPLRGARLDYVGQKATEMGVARLCPVVTDWTSVRNLNRDRLQANAIGAAEQCGILSVPVVEKTRDLGDVLNSWDEKRHIIMCDEEAPVTSPVASLRKVRVGPLALLIGPEGGFSPRERDLLRRKEFVSVLSLGPRILRADTAAIVALGLVQAVLGDCREEWFGGS